MKIIFLDIDGVLNSERYYKSVDRSIKNWNRFDPEVVDLIKNLVEEFSAKIVISSTWRFGAIEQLRDELKKSGLIKYLHKDWRTPEIYPPYRGEEIKSWLDAHAADTEYVIIDDNDSILKDQKIRLVKTEILDGMLERHYSKCRDILANF